MKHGIGSISSQASLKVENLKKEMDKESNFTNSEESDHEDASLGDIGDIVSPGGDSGQYVAPGTPLPCENGVYINCQCLFGPNIDKNI